MRKRIGNYSLQREIGRGAFGTVYQGVDPNGNQVAVKTLLLSKLRKVDRDRIEDEIRCMLKFDHPYIVRLFEVCKTTNNLYLIMEFVQGGDLQGYLDRQVPVNEVDGRRIVMQIVEAMKVLHSNRVIHRDLKPANILITDRDLSRADIKIMDFGFSRNLMNASMLVQSSVGSPVFMAPEVLRSERYSFKADVWSLGALCFEILVGRQAFECDSLVSLQRKQKLPLDFPLDCRLSQEGRDFLQYLLTYNPETRPTIEQALQHPFLNQLPVNIEEAPILPMRESTIIEEANESHEPGEDPEQVKVEDRKESFPNAMLRLESMTAEASFTKSLAEEYKSREQNTIAWFLLRLYKEQEATIFNEAQGMNQRFNMQVNYNPRFSKIYEDLQFELFTVDEKIDELHKAIRLSLCESEILFDYNQEEEVIIEARNVFGQFEVRDRTEVFTRTMLLLTALLHHNPNDNQARQMIDEVYDSYLRAQSRI